MIGIINYGIGNVASIYNILKKINCEAMYINSADDMNKADRLILPGVGAFDAGMKLLEESGLLDALNERVLNKGTPILGICLGMQMLGTASQEGKMEGLGYIAMKTLRINHALPNGDRIKVPHMGWDYVNLVGKSKILDGLEDMKERYYFVHSYHVLCDRPEDVQMTCRYGEELTVAVNHKNIYGVQFHPEKSHKYGMKLLRNFNEI